MALAFQSSLGNVPRPLQTLRDTVHRSLSAFQQPAALRHKDAPTIRLAPAHAATAPRLVQLPNLADFSTLGAEIDEEPLERLRDVKVHAHFAKCRKLFWDTRMAYRQSCSASEV